MFWLLLWVQFFFSCAMWQRTSLQLNFILGRNQRGKEIVVSKYFRVDLLMFPIECSVCHWLGFTFSPDRELCMAFYVIATSVCVCVCLNVKCKIVFKLKYISILLWITMDGKNYNRTNTQTQNSKNPNIAIELVHISSVYVYGIICIKGGSFRQNTAQFMVCIR